MISDARSRRFSLILVVKLDRIARSMPNFYALLEQLNLCGVQFHAVDQPEVSTRTSTGRFLMAIIGAVAEYERELIRERTNAGLARARAQGKALGRPKARIDSERMQQLLRDGKTIREVARELGVSVGTVHRRSKNGAYASPNESAPKSPVPKTSD
jgi:DNA invertase Pin-like site-specific DNA recombinase